jgi:hypothetical protein
MFDTQINVLINEVQTYEWTNVIWILHLPLNLCVKYVFNARYQCVKHTNYNWMNFAWCPLLSYEMLSLWLACNCNLIFYIKLIAPVFLSSKNVLRMFPNPNWCLFCQFCHVAKWWSTRKKIIQIWLHTRDEMKRKEFLYSQLPTGTYHKLLVICKTKNP